MSPSEDDLRRALSDGAGDTPNANAIIRAGRERRAQRQKRLLGGATAVVLVAAVATGGTLLAHNGGTDDSASNGGAGTRAAGAAAGPNMPYVACPSALGASGGLAQSGSSPTATLFAKPVASVVVCAYRSGGGALVGNAAGKSSSLGGASSTDSPQRLQLTGVAAKTLTNSLEHASATRSRGMCPAIRMADQKTILIIATATDGTRLPAVTTTINEVSCAVVVTNGHAVRYSWSPPRSLASQFAALTSGTSGNAVAGSSAAPSDVPASATNSASSLVPPSGRVNGSPAH